MTTSQLSPLSGELHGNDLQTLRDYALEAPWEWRKALDALIERAENAKDFIIDAEEAEDEVQVAREACKDAIKEVREEMKSINAAVESLFKAKLRTNADMDHFRKTLEANLQAIDLSLDELDKASDEPVPGAQKSTEITVGTSLRPPAPPLGPPRPA